MNFDWKGHASMLGANVMWGLMSPVSKVILVGGAITPLVITDLRIGGAMILFWITSFFQKPEHVNHKDLVSLFFASLLAIVFNQGCFIFGVSLTSPGDASIITTSMPLWAMILAAFILKEPITGKKVLGITLGAGGALLLILGSGQNIQITSTNKDTAIWGDLLVLFAQLSYALYIVLYKDFVNKYSLTTIMKWMFTYSFICMLPFSAKDLADVHWGNLQMTEIVGLAFIPSFNKSPLVSKITFLSLAFAISIKTLYMSLFNPCGALPEIVTTFVLSKILSNSFINHSFSYFDIG